MIIANDDDSGIADRNVIVATSRTPAYGASGMSSWRAARTAKASSTPTHAITAVTRCTVTGALLPC
jgi:hypothetical protein